MLCVGLATTIGYAGLFTYQGDPSPTEIKIGLSSAQSGRLSFIGTSVLTGSQAYISQVNAKGGVNGRKITLVSYDDSYEPLLAVNNTEKLINSDGVFALLGYVGTPTCRSVLLPLAISKMKLVGAFTGAGILRDKNAGIYNVRATYDEEAAKLVDHLVNDLGAKRIAIFRQGDSYGDAGKKAALAALASKSLQPVADASYVRNSVDVQDALNAIVPQKPDAVIMIGAYKACAAFILGAKALGLNATYCNVSFVGTEPLIKFLDGKVDSVYVSQVVPSPTDPSIQLVKDYQADMQAAGHNSFDYASLEGYVDARVLVEGLRKAGPTLTQDSFTAAMDSLQIDLGGFTVSYSPEDHKGSHVVFLTRISGTNAIQVDKMQ